MKNPNLFKNGIREEPTSSPLIVRMEKKNLVRPNCIVCTLLAKLKLVLKQTDNIFIWLYTSKKTGDSPESRKYGLGQIFKFQDQLKIVLNTVRKNEPE